ncbi:aminopeptidase P family protein [Tumebacillus permanentifrigoris]|uniref:Xaa-Pro aminopeptidase n=1 Tax=Tumebacillus permanentifrigoris TaxID=378543 RepID=A0A316DGH8_9BACL|nr:aminopeptidase P family protein [Tumebacillus permanentifrigoris]PWK15673.1 aminopeptidase P [Tumebacillus permanentifrigoris]
MKKEFFVQNRKNLHDRLPDQSITLFFAGEAPQKSADDKYVFTPNRNFYYLTGLVKEQLILAFLKLDGKVEEQLYIQRVDPVLEKWEGKMLTTDEAKELTGVATVRYLDEFESVAFNRTLHNNEVHALALDLERRGFDALPTRANLFAQEAKTRYPYLQIVNIYPAVSELRTRKTAEEVAKIKKAAELTNLGIQRMMKHAHECETEYQLEAHFNFALHSAGIRETAFHSIVAAGGNATVLHYSENNCRIGDNELVQIDLGAEFEFYKADISRVIPKSGTFTDRQKQLYNIVLKAELEVIAAIKPGVPFKELNEIAKRVLAEGCIQIGLIQEASELPEYYYHGVSHHLGLDTHDVGNYRELVLEPGMVLTVEPGLYVAAEQIGIRIEDDVLVTEDGHEVLSEGILKTVEEIEAYMAR